MQQALVAWSVMDESCGVVPYSRTLARQWTDVGQGPAKEGSGDLDASTTRKFFFWGRNFR